MYVIIEDTFVPEYVDMRCMQGCNGDVAETLNRLTVENGGSQIIVGRASSGGFSQRLFGSSTQNLVMHADVPVTVVG